MALHGKAHEVRKVALRKMERFGSDKDSIRGRKFPTPFPGSAINTGRMTGQDNIDKFKSSMIVYVVLSYATPIAYVTAEGETVVPDIRYSVTTTNHQHACRVYLNQ